MRKRVIIIILMVAPLLNVTAQNSKEIKSVIKHVTVYPDRAQISRGASISLSSGKTAMKLSALSPYIDLNSIQVKGFGDFTILSVNHQNNYLQNLEEEPEVKNIKSQIKELQLKVEDEKTALNVLKEKEAFLIANRAILVKETTFSIEQFRSLMNLYTDNIEQVNLSTLKKNRLIQDWEKQIAVLQKQIAEKLGKQQLPSGEIVILVSADKQVSGKLSISYVVSNAIWYPSYDIRVDDLKNPVTIIYKANVQQNTGVEWKDVELSFSNATPWVSGDIPALFPWFIDFYIPVPIMGKAKMSVINSRNEAPVMVEMAAEEIESGPRGLEARAVSVNKNIGETSVTFDINVPYTVPTDNIIQTVEIQRLNPVADYKYLTLPKLSPFAYLTALLTDWSGHNLQSGEATLYFENSYVGKSFLNVNQLTDTLTISLGNDNSILVKREKRKDFTAKRIIGSNKTETYSFLISLRNNKSVPVSMTVKDQIPVSSNSDITVEATELSGGHQNVQTGEIVWNLSINPGETKPLVLSYSVKYPKDKTVILE